jgi:hypothetical protein
LLALGGNEMNRGAVLNRRSGDQEKTILVFLLISWPPVNPPAIETAIRF